MYLELHRGTYTSQARTKQGNRRSPSTSSAKPSCGAPRPRSAPAGSTPYPAAELKRLWRLVLLQQFHDILPGSAIAWVHQDAERNYAAVAKGLEALISQAAAAAAWGRATQEFLLNAGPTHAHGVPGARGRAGPSGTANAVRG